MHSGSNVNQESYSTFCKTVTNGLEIKRKVSDADIPEDESVLSTNDTSSSRKRIESNNGNKDEVYVINNYGVEVSHSSLRERRPLTLHTLPLSSPHSRVSRQLEYSGTPKAQSSSKTTKCVVFLIALLGTYTIFHNFVLLNLVNDSGNDENRMRYQTMSLFKPRKRKSRKSYVVQSLMEHHNNRSGIPIFIAVDKEKDLPSERLQLLIDMIEDQNAYSEKRHQKYLLFPFSHDDQIQFLEESISSECFLLNASTLPQQYNSAKLLWKYCSLYLFGGIYLDISKVTLLQTQWMLFSSPSQKKESGSNSTTEMSSDENVFILDLARQQLEESFMIWNEIRSSTLLLILKYILHNMNYTEEQDPTVISKHESTRRHFLFQAYHNTRNNRTSLFLEQRCAYNDETLLSPQKCEVYHPRTSQIVMLTNSDLSGPPLPPCHSSKPDECHPIMFPKHSDELASIISMETIYLNKAQKEQLEQDTKSFVEVSTPNFFQIMLENDCLPTNRHCKACLVSEGSCKKCQSICSCYCNAICHPKFKVRRKLIQKKFIVKIPWQHHHHNMIPRKIHQIWIDELSKEQYPKMSRAVNSFKNSNWGDHYFWDLERDIPTFLQAHFPPEVVNAYNSLTLSRFKSDLARYCLLLVHGGVYAEPDIILNVDLHNAIDKDIGFASVVVNISRPVNGHQASSCLWSGFFASAPGHPFLAKLIEMIVNNIRNRFTSIDYDAMFCPFPPAFELSWTYPNHLTTGSCIFGAAVNSVLGRSLSSPFEAGDLQCYNLNNCSSIIPGRSVIFQPEFTEKKTLRFMNVQENLIIGTSVRSEVETWPESMLYTSAPTGNSLKNSVYGRNGIYVDDVCANEDIILFVSSHHSSII